MTTEPQTTVTYEVEWQDDEDAKWKYAAGPYPEIHLALTAQDDLAELLRTRIIKVTTTVTRRVVE